MVQKNEKIEFGQTEVRVKNVLTFAQSMPKASWIQRVLIIGSGPIVIGQACEFDYSGSQAIRSLKEEGVEVILLNSNPATIMTDPIMADHVYLHPLTLDSLEMILKRHRVDAVLPTMGGQTALNLAIMGAKEGLWDRYGVQVIGADLQAIQITEDREAFRLRMNALGLPVLQGGIARSLLEARKLVQQFGLPVVVRPSYTLGGSGGGIIENERQMEEVIRRGLEMSPVHEVLIEQSIFGWKEFELELLRDQENNFIVICTIENMDPVGIHTGDSITIAPAMTLPDTLYQQMRDMAIQVMGNIGTFAGGCNIQFAVNPETEEIVLIEMNPRVSRSSALASKATGYPIAKIAAKLALGYTLPELVNPITGTTSAYFEPSLDYVVVKIPRWDMDKFQGGDTRLGLQMKSVGEVMAIGRTFPEALQKACQSLEIGVDGLTSKKTDRFHRDEAIEQLQSLTWDRLFHLYNAIYHGIPLTTIHRVTKVDPWFLTQIQKIALLEKKLEKYTLDTLPRHYLMEAKQMGFSDQQLARIFRVPEEKVRGLRQKWGIHRVYKMVDTCAGEFPARTPYFYSTFETENEGIHPPHTKKILILGSGPNRIGQGIEFDYCCVHGALAIRECGYEAIMLNCNPETVSTDFDISSRLYFDPVYSEHLLDLIQYEQPEAVLVQYGGQTALKLAQLLHQHRIPLLGSGFETIDIAEDRGRFSALLQKLGIPHPPYAIVDSVEKGLQAVQSLTYPILVRPSYVLGGQKIKIVLNEEELERHMLEVFHLFPENRVLLDQFLMNAIEAEVDAVCDGENVRIIGTLEHIEPAGIHSGDSIAVVPPFSLSPELIRQMHEYTESIALALNVKGFINIQFAILNGTVYVIEANPRASRTVPFLCKAYGKPYVNYTTKMLLGKAKITDFDWNGNLNGYALKIPVFSFEKFPGLKVRLGPEMRSTGEEIRFVSSPQDPYFQKLLKERRHYLDVEI
jgi:carbamoyl-phosphate synthase large subunit